MRKKKLSFGARFGLAVASFMLGVLLFVTTLATSLLIDIRVITTEDNIRSFVQQFFVAPTHISGNVAHAQNSVGIRTAPVMQRFQQMPRKNNPESVAQGLTQQLIDMLYVELGAQVEGELPVTQERLEELIDQSTVKDFIVDKTAALVTDYFVGEVTTTFAPEEIANLIEENRTIIEEVIGEPLPEEIKQQTVTVFKENQIVQKIEEKGLAGFMEMIGADEGEMFPSGGGPEAGGDSLFGDLGSVMEKISVFRGISSTGNLLIGVGACLLLVAAIIFVNIHQIPAGLRRSGYPLIFVGLLVTVCLAVKILEDMFMGIPGFSLIQPFILKLTPVYATILAMGIALLISGIVLGCVFRRKCNVLEAVQTVEVQAETVPAEEAKAEAAEQIIE